MAAKTLRHPSIEPAHPGEFLAEIVLPSVNVPKTRIAEMLHVSRQTLYSILRKEQGVTPSMAVRLGKLFGNGAEIWLRMQGTHDLWKANRETDVSDIRTLEVA